MNHLELESMNKQDRLTKLMKIYDRVQKWIQSNAGIVSPSDMNIAQTVLREIEELTSRVENIDYVFSKDNMERLNRIWKQYKV
jgi:NADH pyrophosphatase NudC (nudix superfamily)